MPYLFMFFFALEEESNEMRTQKKKQLNIKRGTKNCKEFFNKRIKKKLFFHTNFSDYKVFLYVYILKSTHPSVTDASLPPAFLNIMKMIKEFELCFC